jgi:pimeloyl-ACP methyl ester carboxylesterase
MLMPGSVRHLSVLGAALALCLGTVAVHAGQQTGVAAPATAIQSAQDDPAGTATFMVLLRGARLGSETVTLSHHGSGWMISSVGRLQAPVDMTTTRFEITYGADWQPVRLSVEGLLRGQLITLDTTFGLTTAMSDMLQGGQRASGAQTVSPRTIVLPNNFFAGYEALAARLGTATPGTRLPVFIAPEGEIGATVDRITTKRIATAAGVVDLRQFDLTFSRPGAPVNVEVWTDGRNRLARVAIQQSGVTAVREDIASVTAREEPIHNPGDAAAFIPANGFNLAATITVPQAASGRVPAVILVSGPGPGDRDETSYGIPIFGQLAGALASAGYLVVRFDKRGSGQSGGRAENAAIQDYATDVIAVTSWLRKRKDVDGNRIAAIGYDQGGVVAILAASKEKRIKAVALVAAAGLTGRELTLEQQRHELERTNEPPGSRDAKIELQTRVLDAVQTGTGWENVPADVRRQVDMPWYKGWLTFDPALALEKLKQPILVLAGALDRQVPALQADRLEEFGRARKNAPAAATRKVIVPGINHLLVPATSGEVDEYADLASRMIAPAATDALVLWLRDSLR